MVVWFPSVALLSVSSSTAAEGLPKRETAMESWAKPSVLCKNGWQWLGRQCVDTATVPGVFIDSCTSTRRSRSKKRKPGSVTDPDILAADNAYITHDKQYQGYCPSDHVCETIPPLSPLHMPRVRCKPLVEGAGLDSPPMNMPHIQVDSRAKVLSANIDLTSLPPSTWTPATTRPWTSRRHYEVPLRVPRHMAHVSAAAQVERVDTSSSSSSLLQTAGQVEPSGSGRARKRGKGKKRQIVDTPDLEIVAKKVASQVIETVLCSARAGAGVGGTGDGGTVSLGADLSASDSAGTIAYASGESGIGKPADTSVGEGADTSSGSASMSGGHADSDVNNGASTSGSTETNLSGDEYAYAYGYAYPAATSDTGAAASCYPINSADLAPDDLLLARFSADFDGGWGDEQLMLDFFAFDTTMFSSAGG